MIAFIAVAAMVAAQPLDVAVLKVEGLTRDAALPGAPGWRTVGLDGIAQLPSNTLLVLPEPRVFPAVGISKVEGFLNKGGHLLAVGGPPFQSLVYRRSDGAWVDRETCLAETPAEHPLIDWKAVNGSPVRRGTGNPTARVAYTPLADGYQADLQIPQAASWEVRELPCAHTAPPGDDVLRFRASGQDRAKAMLIEVREQDGSRWMAVVPLTPEEREIGIHRSAFKFWHDGSPPNRGGKGDMPDFAHIAAIQAGFAASHQTLHAGRYVYTIRGLATGRCTAEVITPSLPKLEGLCPPYKLFEAHPARSVAEGAFAGLALSVPGDVWSAIARPMFEASDRDYFWQPQIKAFNDAGVWCATPLSTVWRKDGATWTLLGWQPGEEELKTIVNALAGQLGQGKPATAPPPLEDDQARGACVTVFQGRFVLDGRPWFAHGINFWPLYVGGMEPPEYFSHWLKRADYMPELVEEDLATLESIGVNLVSIQYERVEEAAQLRDFLTRCGRHGIKVNIFLGGSHPLDPSASDDLSKRPFLDLMRAANVQGNPHVFAYDLAWEPRLGVEKERQRFDPLWRAWVDEQYGGVEQAEHVWGTRANRSGGDVTGPTDEQLMEDGPHRAMVAAYRRFADDLISRRYGEFIRLARTIDDSHLFGARTGYGGTGTPGVVRVMPFQVTSGAAHLDFISPEGYGYGPENIADAALVSAYCRWAGNGKPVFWAEFGRSVLNGGQEALGLQGDLFRAFAGMLKRSNADGWAGWWYPGGLRVDENSDFGIIAPDRAIRPSAQVLRSSAGDLKNLAAYEIPADTLTVNRDASSSGLSGVVERHSADFKAALAGGKLLRIVTAGTGTTSLTCPLTGVGGVPFQAPGPPEFLNAELRFGVLPGGKFQVEALNTGEAAWAGGDCALQVITDEGLTKIPLKNAVPRFGIATFDLDTQPRSAVLWASRFGEFGQRLHG